MLDAPQYGGYPRLVKPLRNLLLACMGLICIAGLTAQGDPTVRTEDAALSDIVSKLASAGIPFEKRPLFARYGGFGTSIHIDIPGKAGDRGSIALATSLSSAAINQETLIALAQSLLRSGSPIPVRIAFLADEKTALPGDLAGTARLGLQDLADRYDEKERTAVIYLDLPEHSQYPAVEHGSKGTVAPLGLLKPLADAFKAHNHPLAIAFPFNELYRLGLVDGSDALQLLHGQGFPALILSETPKPAIRAETTRPELTAPDGAAILATWVAGTSEIPLEMDRHYTLLSVGDALLPFSEWISVSLFILLAALALGMLLVYSLTHRTLIMARGKLFLIRSWVLLLNLALLLLCFYISKWYLNLVTAIVHAPRYSADYGTAIFRIILALSLFFLANHFVTHWKIPRRSHYYSTAASALFAIGLVVAASLDFSFVPLFMWAFLISLIAGIIHSRSLAWILAVLAPLPVVIAIAAAAGSGETGTANLILNGDFQLQLYLAFILQPFLFLFKRARTLPKKKPGAKVKRRPVSRALFLLGILAAVSVYLGRNAARLAEQAPAIRTYEQERLADLTVTLLPRLFLDRQNLEVTVSMKGSPERLRLWFESDSEIVIYDAPMPLEWSDDRRHCECILGENPPGEVRFEFTLPRDFQGKLHAEAIHLVGPNQARILTVTEERGGKP